MAPVSSLIDTFWRPMVLVSFIKTVKVQVTDMRHLTFDQKNTTSKIICFGTVGKTQVVHITLPIWLTMSMKQS